ncbi:hypothetical protein ACFVMC_30525 [Nocardia sp. NPDC127579]|uniref:hypothetical protein n=1 Tax=Nocardia sp. NPDC127579 TaxID=3345402 RepID=UPI00363F3970
MNRIRRRFLGIAVLVLAPMGGAVQASAAGSMVLTNADSARTVHTDLGSDVEIRLGTYRENGFTYTWHPPVSSDPAVLPTISASVTPAGDAVAVFRAEAPGDAVISAQRSCRPEAGRRCPSVMLPWKATVRVR